MGGPTELRVPVLNLERAAHQIADHPSVGPDDGVLVALVSQDRGGVSVGLGFAGLAIEDAELAAGHMLRAVRDFMTEHGDRAHCPACAKRWARVTAAILALEADGARPIEAPPATLQ